MVFIRRNGESGEGCDVALCEACAKGRGISASKGGLELNIDDLISVGLDASRAPGRPISCPVCGLELGALKREGRLGCSSCADVFFEEIVKAIGRRAIAVSAEDEVHKPLAAAAQIAGAESQRLKAELESAIASEDYEKAAQCRDELSRMLSAATGAYASLPVFASDFPLDPNSLSDATGPEDDVVLWSSAEVYRDITGLAFPGSPRGPSAPSRSLLLEKILSYGSWKAKSMAELGPVGRRSLSERGVVLRGYAADDDAVLISSAAEGAYAILDEGDHLRVRGQRPGLDAMAALAPPLAFALRLGQDFEFARKSGIGWISSRLADCGLGSSLSVTVHLPALAATGMRDRLFRALLADGVVVRGFYSSGEESVGSVYELGIEPSAVNSVEMLVSSITAAAVKVIAAERRARAEISERGRDALVDAEGRAFGIIRYCGLLVAEEAASLVSILRLGALRGSFTGVDQSSLALLLTALGPGSVALAQGLREMPAASTIDSLRARLVKDAFARAEYRVEEGA
jgi:protein arginine kinase activator